MSLLRARGLVAVTAAALAVLIHPTLSLHEHTLARAAIATLALVLVVALAARAPGGGPGDRLLALGALVTVCALGWDGVRGHRGTLTLVPGQATQNFTELGPDRRPLGLRPLGFQVSLDALRDASAVLTTAGRSVTVTPSQGALLGGLRFGRPSVAATGGLERLHLTLSDAAGRHELVLRSGEAIVHADVEVSLEQYFADFALDARNEPFSRSDEPRNPGALLKVHKAGQSFRVFVLASAPGIHQVEGLAASFTLTGVEPERVLTLRVARAPAAAWALLGVLCGGIGLALQARLARGSRIPNAPLAAAGVMLCAALLTLGQSEVLRWSWASELGGAPVALRGVGLTLGVALLVSLGGVLLVGVPLVASAPAAQVPAAGRRAELLGATLSGIGAVLLVSQAGFGLAPGHEAVLLALAAAAVFAAFASADAYALPRAVAAALATVVALTGIGSWSVWGGYDTAAVDAAASLALLALAVSE